MSADPLSVVCPICERKPGYPCQNLSGSWYAKSWQFDDVQGGMVGYKDKATPHEARRSRAVAKARRAAEQEPRMRELRAWQRSPEARQINREATARRSAFRVVRPS